MLRNFIFSLFFFSGIVVISIIFLPSFFLPNQIALFGGKLMGHWASFCLKFILSTKIIIKGSENIINDEKFFIAASHQSMFETFFLQTLFNSPVFILKKELLLIPIFGWYLKKIGSISIKRGQITKDNLGFLDKISNKTYEFVGPICESTDKFVTLKRFQRIEEKDLIAICDVGAYGMSLSSNYNLRPKPIELLIQGSKIKVIRKRQKHSEII